MLAPGQLTTKSPAPIEIENLADMPSMRFSFSPRTLEKSLVRISTSETVGASRFVAITSTTPAGTRDGTGGQPDGVVVIRTTVPLARSAGREVDALVHPAQSARAKSSRAVRTAWRGAMRDARNRSPDDSRAPKDEPYGVIEKAPAAAAVVLGRSSTHVRPGASETTSLFGPVNFHGSVTNCLLQVTLIARPSRNT